MAKAYYANKAPTVAGSMGKKFSTKKDFKRRTAATRAGARIPRRNSNSRNRARMTISLLHSCYTLT